MKTLFVLDEKNYGDDWPVILKTTVRAVIEQDGLLAMQRSASGEYKIPGGGIEDGETWLLALQREVREETGLIVIPESVEEIGEIIEYREDIFSEGYKYEAHAYYYRCAVTGENVGLSMTESEKAAGYHLEWASADEIIRCNTALMKERWKLRDTEFLKVYQNL